MEMTSYIHSLFWKQCVVIFTFTDWLQCIFTIGNSVNTGATCHTTPLPHGENVLPTCGVEYDHACLRIYAPVFSLHVGWCGA